jgi:hypothetical protein
MIKKKDPVPGIMKVVFSAVLTTKSIHFKGWRAHPELSGQEGREF